MELLQFIDFMRALLITFPRSDSGLRTSFHMLHKGTGNIIQKKNVIRITAKRNNWSMENFKSLFKPKCIKSFLLMTFFPFAQGGYRTSECACFLLRRFVFPLRHLHICHNAPYLPPKFCITFFFHFSRVLQPSQEKLKTMLMQNFRGQIRCMGDVQVAHKGERETRVTGDEAQRNHGKEKEERWSGSRPFSPSRLPFPANFYRERERETSTYEEPSSPFLILVSYEQNSQNFSWHWDTTFPTRGASCSPFVINSSAIFKNRLLFPDLFYYHYV